jgi:hypothetical protein
MRDLRDVGGTQGGLGHFVFGLALAGTGIYLLLDRIAVSGGYWGFAGSGQSSFGITLIPLLIGIGMLFYRGRSVLGWVLFLGSLGAIIVGVLANLQIHFQGGNLITTLIILGLIASGVGLIVRSLSALPTSG